MTSPPEVGEYIAVKELSVDESYSPVYSNYRNARVLKVDGIKLTMRYVGKFFICSCFSDEAYGTKMTNYLFIVSLNLTTCPLWNEYKYM